MTTGRVRARVFGEVADDYDRYRPGYPEALVDDVLRFAGLSPTVDTDAAALEVGAGTGKATVAFAGRGLVVTAVEPDAAMAAVLRRRVAPLPSVAVVVSSLEDYRPERRFQLLFSAQAWHWTDPATRWQHAADVLRPGGALALFWNHERIADTRVRDAISAAHRELAPSVEWDDDPIDERELVSRWPYQQLAGRPEFDSLQATLYRWTWTVTAQNYLSLLSTQSAYRMLDGQGRAAIFDAMQARLDGRVDLEMYTLAFLARRTP